MAEHDYKFENDGIASLIKRNLLKVPSNQRPYAWEDEHVKQLLIDIDDAIQEDEDQYFLGTVVLVESDQGRRLIADGQQRVATSTIILARIRDLLKSYGEDDDAADIQTKYLKSYIRKEKGERYVLQMNSGDDAFFREKIIDADWEDSPPTWNENWTQSNGRLYKASQIARIFLRKKVSDLKPDKAVKTLNEWADFLEEKIGVVAVIVPDEVGAFRMFETLNDRGLRASQADILKNYLFSRVTPTELDTVHSLWSQIYASLEDISADTDEQLIRYLKHFWTLSNGLTRDRDLASDIKKKVRTPAQALKFISDAKIAVSDYVAIFNSNDPKWKSYGSDTEANIKVLSNVINIEQIVPLVFAVSRKFSVIEAKKSFSLFVSWSVRLMLGNSGRAGRLDKQYADLAQDVGTDKKKTAKSLRDALSDKVPNDTTFQKGVMEARVSNSILVRYYLIAIEKHLNGGTGELEPSEDVTRVNLEHIIPKTFRSDLDVSRAEHADLLMRLGNQTVMQSGMNRESANKPFKDKKAFYAKSKIGITKELAKLSSFKRSQIDARQKRFAQAATQIWTLKF